MQMNLAVSRLAIALLALHFVTGVNGVIPSGSDFGSEDNTEQGRLPKGNNLPSCTYEINK